MDVLNNSEKDICDYVNSKLFITNKDNIDNSVSLSVSSDTNIKENIYLFNNKKIMNIEKNWKEYITSIILSDSKNASEDLSIEKEISHKVYVKRNRDVYDTTDTTMNLSEHIVDKELFSEAYAKQNTENNWNAMEVSRYFPESTKENTYKYKIIGAKTVHYISELLIPHTKYILYCKNINDKKIEIIIGVNTLHIKYITEFKNITMIPNKNIFIDIQVLYNINNHSYNPYSELINNIMLFNKTLKHKDNRPVWIYGGSCKKGINYFRQYIKSFSIDENKILPDIIACDTIIMSTILQITLNDIKNKCIGNNEYIFVGFEKIRIKNNSLLSKINSCKHIYIFTGDKNLGKRHIAHSLNTDNIYETKFSLVLPNELNHDIVIISPNSNFTYLDIIDKYNGNYVFISVHFSKV